MAAKLTNNYWTDEEVQMLKDNYAITLVMDIACILPRHSISSLHMKAQRLGLKQLNPHSRERPPELCKKLSQIKIDYYRTHDAPFKGKRHSSESKKLLSEAATRQFSNPKFRKLASDTMRAYFSNPENKQLFIQHRRQYWANHPEVKLIIGQQSRERFNDPVFLEKYHNAITKKPNELEQRINDIIINIGLPFEYNGDFSLGVVLNGMIPDFVNTNGKKQVIEVFGDYWHGNADNNSNWETAEDDKIRNYAAIGFDCLILWEHDIKSMTNKTLGEKIRSFTEEVHHSY